MPNPRTKQFRLSQEYDLFAVDCWWAGLLQTGLKEIVSIEWEALGQLEWRLHIGWVAIEGGERLNVGHPQYADMMDEDLEEIMEEVLAEFEVGLHEYGVIEAKVQQWGLKEVGKTKDGDTHLIFRDDLDEAEKLIATDFLWTAYTLLGKWLRQQRTKLKELDRERRVRKEKDYFAVSVDRSLLRDTFVDQLGYHNEWLFDDVEELDLSGDE